MKKAILRLIILITALPLFSQIPENDSVKIIRDQWGVPHIIADNEYALFYGAGYAAAEDRLFQMCLARRSIQGRLAEIFGRNYVDHDKTVRTIDYYSHARRSFASLEPETVEWLEAYAAGVNAYMADNPRHMKELFDKYGGPPEPWKAEDGIACFSRIAHRFDGGWQNEVNALRQFEQLVREVGRDSAYALMEMRLVDDQSSIVSKEEYEAYDEKLDQMRRGKTEKKSKNESDKIQSEWEAPKMSHNWCVSGSKSKTGKPILESDPQIAVEAPSTWYEFHLHGGRFNVRGISVPGTPSMLIGFNENVSWGMTALGSDNADLFMEKRNPENEDQYEFEGEWLEFDKRTDVIKVQGQRDVEIEIRSTIHGPVVTDLLSGTKPDEEFSLSYIGIKTPATDVEGLLDMMSSANWDDFTAGMAKYRSPGVHVIYADKFDNIGYYTLARLPQRANNAGVPFAGWTGTEEWQGLIPFDSMPRMLNPDAGYISTANNLPIGSWYPYRVGGGIGDNARSWRLRELMESQDEFSIEDFFDVHRDMTNPIVRDFVIFSMMAVDAEQPDDRDVLAAFNILDGWDYNFNTNFDGYTLIESIRATIHRSLRGTAMEDDYLGGAPGLSQLFRDLEDHYEKTGELTDDPDIRTWLIDMLGLSYRNSGIEGYPRPVVVSHEMKYQNNLEGFGSLHREYDMTSPPLSCPETSTIWSQRGNSYSQIVNHANVDSSWSFIPPGNSEVPDSRHFDDLVDMWMEGGMHPAPLSISEAEKYEEDSYILYLGLNSVEDKNDTYDFSVRIFPNPVQDNFNIEFLSAPAGKIEISFFTLNGMHIANLYSGYISAKDVLEFQIGDLNLPAGMYLLEIRNNDEPRIEKITLIK